MYNAQIPNDVTLPSSAKLIKSTIIAFMVAMALLITVVLPSEYGIDPTGVGKVLGLKEMGEIKTQLAQEAEADRQADLQSGKAASVAQVATSQPIDNKTATIDPATARQDKTEVTLTTGEGIELKLPMAQGAVVNYRIEVMGGKVNYDMHGDGSGESISYKKDRGISSDSGQLVAKFTGNHGWFFRNRDENPVTVILTTEGNYSEVKTVK